MKYFQAAYKLPRALTSSYTEYVCARFHQALLLEQGKNSVPSFLEKQSHALITWSKGLFGSPIKTWNEETWPSIGQTSYLTRFSYSGSNSFTRTNSRWLSFIYEMVNVAIERRVVPREGAGLQNEFTFWGRRLSEYPTISVSMTPSVALSLVF